MGRGGGGGDAWTPAKLANINKWYDAKLASSITYDPANGNAVSKWVDRITGGDAAAYKQSSVAIAPVYDAAAQAIVYDGTKGLNRDHALPTGNIVLTWIIIAKSAGDNAARYLINHAGSGRIRLYFGSGAASLLLRSTATLTLAGIVSDVMADKYRLLMATYNNSGDSQMTMYKCGGTVGSPTDQTVTGDAGTSTFSQAATITLGADSLTPSNGYIGAIKGMISVLGVPSADEIAKLRAWAIEYYGVDTI